MSTKRTSVTKKITWSASGEKVFVFNNPNDTNAFESVKYDGVTVEKLNQTFKGIFVNNVSDYACYFTANPNITAGPAAVDEVMVALKGDGIRIDIGLSDLRIYLAGAGDVYITLY